MPRGVLQSCLLAGAFVYHYMMERWACIAPAAPVFMLAAWALSGWVGVGGRSGELSVDLLLSQKSSKSPGIEQRHLDHPSTSSGFEGLLQESSYFVISMNFVDLHELDCEKSVEDVWKKSHTIAPACADRSCGPPKPGAAYENQPDGAAGGPPGGRRGPRGPVGTPWRAWGSEHQLCTNTGQSSDPSDD